MQQATTLTAVASNFEAQVTSLTTSAATLARVLNSAPFTERVKEVSRTDLDKLSELVLKFLVGQKDVELRMSDIAKRIGVEASSITRKVQRLEEANLVERVTDPHDARAWHLKLTPAGRDTLERLDAARRQLIGEVVATWPAAELSRFADSFEHFISDLRSSTGESLD